MNEPNLDDLSVLISSKFSLVTLAMKRARQLKAGSRPLIDTMSQKPVTIALQEILEEKVRLGPMPPSDVLEKEEQEAMLHAIGLSEPTSVSVTRRMEEIFGRDEEAGTDYDEDYDDYDDEEPEREEEDEIETEKDVLETEDDEDEEEGLVAGPRRGADFLTDETTETADEEIEEDPLLEIEDDDSEDDEEEEDEEQVSEEVTVEEEAPAAKRAKAEPAAKTPKAKAEKAEKPAAAAKKTAKAAKADEPDEEAPAKKPGRKPKA